MDIQHYFRSYQDYFWQWEEQTNVLAIPKGNTISYKAFAIDILERLSTIGAPPFGALLLTIIATNTTASTDLKHIEQDFDAKFMGQEDGEFRNTRHEAFDFLKKLSNLPAKYKTGKERIELFFSIFMDCHNRISTKKITKLLAEYNQKKEQFESILLSGQQSFSLATFYKDFRVIELLNNQFKDTQAIIDHLIYLPKIQESTLDELIETPTEGTTTSPEELIEQLINTPQSFYIGALVKHLWSGLNLPFQRLKPSEQPLGGVADITNKGNFDRLLISEFAYDNLSFLSRLVNNEALYLHREAPPDSNHLERMILIDISIKNWGTVRTLAYAIMLAIAHHPKAQSNSKIAIVGSKFTPIGVQYPHEVIDSLQILDSTIDCSDGLSFFLKNNSISTDSELIFISSEAAIQTNEMQQLLTTHHRQFSYWISTDSAGIINIYKYKNRGKKLIQRLQLPLAYLWKRDKKTTPKQQPATSGMSSCPILFPKPLQPKKLLSTTDGEVFVVTTEKHLMRFYGKGNKYNKKGWELIYKKLPVSSGNYEVGLTSEGHYLFLAFNIQDRTITLINLTTGKEIQKRFTKWRASSKKDFLFHEDQFFYLMHHKYWVIDSDHLGEVKEPPSKELNMVYEERVKTFKQLASSFGYGTNLLKNVHRVGISVNGNLVFNGIHEFMMNPYGVIKLDNTSPAVGMELANRNTNNKYEFIFEEGSIVRVNRSGITELISSNIEIPTIYIPMLLDAALGIGTEDCFSGNDFFHPSDKSKLAIMNTKKFWEAYILPFVNTIKGI